MKKFVLAFVLTFEIMLAAAQNSDSTLDILNWNIEWLGSATNGPSNKVLQQENVIKILIKYLDTDIYGERRPLIIK